MKRDSAPDQPASEEIHPDRLIETLQNGLARCHALVAEANRVVRSTRHASHTRLAAVPAAPRAVPADPLAALGHELDALRERIDRAGLALRAARSDRSATDDRDPPVFDGARGAAPTLAPRDVDPVVWCVLRKQLASSGLVTIELHRGTARDGVPRTLTGQLARLGTGPDGRTRVAIAVNPEVEQVLLVSSIARATAVDSR